MISTEKKGVDWGSIFAVLAFGLFMMVLVVILGGWLVSIAWASFMVPVFALPAIEISQGIALMFLLYAGGYALGFRRNNTIKTD